MENDDVIDRAAEERFAYTDPLLQDIAVSGFREGVAWQRQQPVEITEQMIDEAEKWIASGLLELADNRTIARVVLEQTLGGKR